MSVPSGRLTAPDPIHLHFACPCAKNARKKPFCHLCTFPYFLHAPLHHHRCLILLVALSLSRSLAQARGQRRGLARSGAGADGVAISRRAKPRTEIATFATMMMVLLMMMMVMMMMMMMVLIMITVTLVIYSVLVGLCSTIGLLCCSPNMAP